MASPIQATGLGSNLDVSGLVSKLMEVEKQPLTKLTQDQASVTLKISAFGTFKGSVSSLQASLAGLQQASAFNASKVTVADAGVASASAQSGADPGTHSLEVTSLAVAQRLKTATTFTKTTDTVGSGTLTLDFGSLVDDGNGGKKFQVNSDHPTQNIKIDAAHSSLSGVRDAINAAKAGVSASIVNDGTGNRLVISSNSTGTTNSIRLTVADDDTGNTDASGLSQLAYDPATGGSANMQEVIGAADAKFKLDGLDVTKASNTVSDVLEGTTINLLKTNKDAPTTLTIAQDTSGMKASVDGFVKAYNEMVDGVTKLTGYDAASKVAGTLSGEPAIRSLAQQIRATMSSVVAGGTKGFNSLSQVGITFDSEGKLSVNASKLDTALRSNPAAVQALFATGTQTSDSLVKYEGATSSTTAGVYAVNIGALATQSKVVGSQAANLTIDNVNDVLNLSVNGVSTSVTLTQGVYADASALASELQTRINGSSTLSSQGISVSVTQTNGVLTLTSNQYGSASKIVFEGGSTAEDPLFGAGRTVTNGVDVSGSLGGNIATGSGQTLKASNGLAVSVLGGATGDRGNVTYSRGIAVQLDSLLSKALGDKGSIASSTHALEAQNKDMDAQKERINSTLAEKEQRYLKQFNSLDSMISSMQSTMAYMSQQLNALNSNK